MNEEQLTDTDKCNNNQYADNSNTHTESSKCHNAECEKGLDTVLIESSNFAEGSDNLDDIPLCLRRQNSEEITNNLVGNNSIETIDEIEEKEFKETTGQPAKRGSRKSTNNNQTNIRKTVDKKNRTYNISCELCDKTFRKNQNLKLHMYRHSASRPLKCELCSKEFKAKIYLSRHINLIHNDSIQMYSCEHCDGQFRSKGNLKSHTILKHTNDYNYTCHKCNNKFKLKDHYLTHMKNHETGPCVCDACGNVYTNWKSLRQHKNQMHTVKVKNFECNICKKRFVSEKNLDSHSKGHKIKYVCEHCGRQFKIRDYLIKHLPTHTGVKPYQCPICDQSFTLLGSQQVHLLKHAGERPYICDICEKTFTHRSAMMLHRKKQHPGSNAQPPPPPVKLGGLLKKFQDRLDRKKAKRTINSSTLR